MSEYNILKNPFIDLNDNNISTSLDKCKFISYNNIVSINPNILALEDKIPKCPICLGYVTEPTMINVCSHIFCKFCLEMWFQKKENCPLCRKKINGITKLYFPKTSSKKNTKLEHLFFSIKHVKLDNCEKFIQKCLICGKKEPENELILCDCCYYFYSHYQCDPPLGLSHGKFYCKFCRKKFVEALK